MTLNRVMLIGNLGRDPEVRHTKSGDAVANFPVATTERWRDRQGQRQERTEWHQCVVWRQQAELAQNYLRKGSRVYLDGRLETRDWVDNENVRRFRTEVIVNTIRFLDSRADSERSEGVEGERSRPSQEATGGAAAPQKRGRSAPPPLADEEPYLEDDVPF